MARTTQALSCELAPQAPVRIDERWESGQGVPIARERWRQRTSMAWARLVVVDRTAGGWWMAVSSSSGVLACGTMLACSHANLVRSLLGC